MSDKTKVVEIDGNSALGQKIAEVLGLNSNDGRVSLSEAKANTEKLIAAGYNNNDLCAMGNASEVILAFDFDTLTKLQHLARDHDILSAARALEAIMVFFDEAVSYVNRAGDKAGVNLLPSISPDKLRGSLEAARSIRETLERKHAFEAEIAGHA